VPPSGLLGERPFESSQWEAPLQRSSIGVQAAGMIVAGDTVILDVGTTTTPIARALVLRTELHDVTVSAFETPGLAQLPGLDPERAYRVEPVAVAGEAETQAGGGPGMARSSTSAALSASRTSSSADWSRVTVRCVLS
jgi:hypothetical protein